MADRECVRSDSEGTPTGEALNEFSRTVLELVSELAPCSEEKLFIAAATRELRGAGNWSLLRLKQELHEALRQLADQGLVRINEQEISLTEPETIPLTGHGGVDTPSEPAMEEVLGSIRQIIRDNETAEAQAQTATPNAQTENKGLEGKADNQIIDGIAGVLSSGGDEPADESEEIIDLTNELGGLELVEEEPEEVLEMAELADAAPTDLVDSSEATEELVELDEVPPDGPEPDILELEALEVVEPAPEAETVEVAEFVELVEIEASHEDALVPERTPLAPAPAPQPVPTRSAESRPSPGQWASARLERARLRAGQAATSSAPPAELAKAPTPPSFGKMSTAPSPAQSAQPAPSPLPAASSPPPWVETEMPRLDLSMQELAPEAAPEAPDLSASMEEVALAVRDAVAALKASHSPSVESAPSPAGQEAPTFEAVPASAFDWSDEEPGEKARPMLGWLVENFPRRMRAHIPVEAEVRVSSSMTDNLPIGLVGSGETVIHEFEVAKAMSLKLSAPKGGFIIESQSPETQWVSKEREGQSNESLALWRFTVTPTRRGSNVLRLTFSYKAVAGGIVADSALPDKVLDIVVATNFGRNCAKAAAWLLTLILGAALGAYFQPLMQLAGFPG
jgi:hypothetical protein